MYIDSRAVILKENETIIGIQFVTDDKGQRVAVQIDLKKRRGHLAGLPRWPDFRKPAQGKGHSLPAISAARLNAAASVVSYSLEIKPSAQKELDTLDDTVFAPDRP
jgi:hypothetical protein